MQVLILGTRGIPARHGGFETFAESLALYLTSRGHEITVYCQADIERPIYRDRWEGVHRVHIFAGNGPAGTIAFDLASVRHSLTEPGVPLILGYNTAIFSVLYRVYGRASLMNMDGIEWKRDKWSASQRLWLRFNEWLGAKISTHLIADHPEIAKHIERHVSPAKITTIPYGSDEITSSQLDFTADTKLLGAMGLTRGNYGLVIARPEPENSILEIVTAYSSAPRGIPLIVLGKVQPEANAYHKEVRNSASSEVIFPGAIYDRSLVGALRRGARVYLHGHRVGGTNPSLVEALAAQNPIIAHDNVFTRWVAGDGAAYFKDISDLQAALNELLPDANRLQQMTAASAVRYREEFTQTRVLGRYEQLLELFADKPVRQYVSVSAAIQRPQTNHWRAGIRSDHLPRKLNENGS